MTHPVAHRGYSIWDPLMDKMESLNELPSISFSFSYPLYTLILGRWVPNLIFVPCLWGWGSTEFSIACLSVRLSVWVYPGHLIHHYAGIWATCAPGRRNMHHSGAICTTVHKIQGSQLTDAQSQQLLSLVSFFPKSGFTPLPPPIFKGSRTIFYVWRIPVGFFLLCRRK